MMLVANSIIERVLSIEKLRIMLSFTIRHQHHCEDEPRVKATCPARTGPSDGIHILAVSTGGPLHLSGQAKKSLKAGDSQHSPTLLNCKKCCMIELRRVQARERALRRIM